MAALPRLTVQLAFVAACCAPLPARGQEPLVVRLIAASTTDPAIDDVNGVHHVAIGPAGQRIGRLLLYLPGTTASPQQYATLIERAATLGYHAIGLAYVNEVPVNTLCAGMGAGGCHEQVRREILFGTDESGLVEVDAENGVFHRLERLLAHLETLAPDEHWSLYRNASGAVRWNRVVVSGHSQGAGHAAFIARLYQVARAVLFSGTEPAPWTHDGTPAFQPVWDHLFAPEPSSVPAIGPSGTVALAALLVALATWQMRRAGWGAGGVAMRSPPPTSPSAASRGCSRPRGGPRP